MHTTIGSSRALALLVALCSALIGLSGGVGCATETDGLDLSNGAVSETNPTPVKRQVVGNCWLYAVTGWVESLHKSATKEELDLSESYLTYWSWFDQLSRVTKSCAIVEGGDWGYATDLVRRYGMMREGDFIPEDRGAASSSRQEEALQALDAKLALESSPLRKAMRDHDAAAIRRELDDAWKLNADTRALLVKVFGSGAPRTFDASSSGSSSDGRVISPNQLVVSGATSERKGSLSEALTSWREVNWDGEGGEPRRELEQRVQRALNDGMPVPISWWVDFRSLKSSGRFAHRVDSASGEGGGHLSLITDYEVTDVPGVGTLEAGKVETRKEALAAALSPEAKVTFFRIKNSWGYWPRHWRELIQRAVGGTDFGYNDLDTSYLFEPVLVESTIGTGDSCAALDAGPAAKGMTVKYLTTPLLAVTLPPGY